MPVQHEAQLVTSDEFITDLLCELSLQEVNKLKLSDTFADARFEKAFRDLVADQGRLNVILDFSLAVNPHHGDSSTLRETLYALRERGIVAINNPKFKTVEVQVDAEDAEYYINRSSLPKTFLEGLVRKYFVGEDLGIGEPKFAGSTATAT